MRITEGTRVIQGRGVVVVAESLKIFGGEDVDSRAKGVPIEYFFYHNYNKSK